MGAPGVVKHTCVSAKKSQLKRDKIYVFDAMNLLYGLCSISVIADLLVQKPAVPTRETVSTCFYL